MLEIIAYALVGSWIGAFITGLVISFYEIRNRQYPQYNTGLRDYSNFPVVFMILIWPTVLSEYIVKKLFG